MLMLMVFGAREIENPDLFFIVETKIKIKYPKAKGWNIEYKRRAKKEFEGGGVGVMIKDEIRKTWKFIGRKI